MKITEAEILDAIRAATSTPETSDGATIRELSKATGWFDGKVREAIRPFVESRQIKCTRGRRMALDGRVCVVPVYCWVGKKGK